MRDLSPIHELIQMQAKLWQATALVLLCTTDDRPPDELIELDDYYASAADFEDYGALASDRLAADVVRDFAHLESDWAAHKQLSASLVRTGSRPDLGTDERVALVHRLWQIALKIDQDLEVVRTRTATLTAARPADELRSGRPRSPPPQGRETTGTKLK